MILCPYCDVFRDKDQNLMFHVKFKHKRFMHLQTTCPNPGCGRIFGNIYTYKSHYKSKHLHASSEPKDFSANSIESLTEYSNNTLSQNSVSNQSEAHEIVCRDMLDDTNIVLDEWASILPSYLDSSGSMKDLGLYTDFLYRYVAGIVAKLHSNIKLTTSGVVNMLDILIDFYNSSFIQILLEKSESNIKTNLISEIINNAFQTFKSEHLSLKYFQENNCLILPEPFPIQVSLGYRTIKARVQEVEIKDYIQVIDISKIITRFLELPNVLNAIILHIENCENSQTIDSIFKGELYKSLKDRCNGEIIIPILPYNDDFEINNVLGSRKGKSKMGAVYFTLLGLPPEFASQLENIFLLQLHKYVHHRDLGNSVVFSQIIEQLKKIQEEGLIINHNGQRIRIKFPLFSIAGDNLALNKILGFPSTNATMPCRFCTAPKEKIRTLIEEDVKYLRSPSDHDSDSVTGENGISEPCIFHKIPHYNCIKQGVVDVLHDLNEGVCRYDMGQILNSLIFKDREIPSVQFLNKRIAGFNYIADSNAVPFLSEEQIKSNYLILSASEMSFLVENLGLLIGDKISKNNKAWKLYILLRDIMILAYGESFSEDIFQTLNEKIKKHHELYLKLYKSLTVKFHNLLHLVRVIRQMGPPRHYSCIRFEGRHKIFKAYASVCNSRVNPEYSLAKKNQLLLAYRFLSSQGVSSRINLGKILGNVKILGELSKFAHLIKANFLQDSTIVSSVRVNGTLYKENYIILINEHEFGKIKYIVVTGIEVKFLYFKLKTRKIEKHLGACCVQETDDTEIIDQKDLLKHSPTVINQCSDGKKYVSHKYV